ncbi:MAG: TerB family tellurite resistance protein [Gemmatimonadetes bacterium]|nr:TerB family tellurite resistance protein [Gemmatimonadota bacterium]
MQTSDLAAIRCPYCNARTVACAAKARWIRGFLLAYQLSTRTLIGCVRCVRIELLKECARSALLGWFSITALIVNPGLIIYNAFRAVTLRSNPETVLQRLREMGYSPAATPDVVQIGYSLAAALIAADGKVDAKETEMAEAMGPQIFAGFDPVRFREVCAAPQNLPPADRLAALLRTTLSVEQKDMLFDYLVAIAHADSEVAEQETAQLNAVAAGLELDIEDWRSRRATRTGGT